MCYESLFGLLLFFGEFRWKFFLTKFPFLLTRANRGFFMILYAFLFFNIGVIFFLSVGSLVLGMYLNKWRWPCYVIAGWTMACGLIYVLIACFIPNFTEDKLKSEVQRDLEHS
jgi:MFS family permease